ncbi:MULTISPECIES: DUF202 domain-containing protein [Dehalococcoides]|jgi:uncharacterized membrane protein YidH (DUF202 family)|uniref:DUF202 domain-containing protein n=2 Tax=Dehalococcoides mccartyi TaxID=61435 RepID=A0A142V8X4_9CHLR|nr:MULTISPECIES: DUF202 domain-containing protein [Dehalococcoides]AGG06145.1 hypothetical protein dcmb_517 [Dehalococcoides mccartyi DCMB5]AGG07577.1 hypothetical protein btf_471 [Dehalococcoides mccartyi BTF08]AII60609.1 hypothetical protein X794_01955 [Dehalococcoides mccartyi CG5]AMU86274.1 hypothetical protein Dm11a5_0448 [Dehalococcoides mccartyi]AOV99111.1 hypothetical protein DCWBC2_0447 [Dehalococcoides mccartyi]
MKTSLFYLGLGIVMIGIGIFTYLQPTDIDSLSFSQTVLGILCMAIGLLTAIIGVVRYFRDERGN